MKASYFLSYTLIIFLGWSMAFFGFYKHFNDPEQYVEKISELDEYLAQAEFQNQLLKDQMVQFHMEVSEILPQELKKAPEGEKSYPLRSLASVVNSSDLDTLKVQKAILEFNRAKIQFSKGNYQEARRMFLDFIEKRPFSVKIQEAFFLLAESYFRLEDYERCVLTAEKMLELFPDSELTGFTLLRVGKVYEYNERPEEAVDIYKTVLKSFPHRGIASQAKKSLRTIQL